MQVRFPEIPPEREQPLKTELRVASCAQNLDALADDWLAANIKRGWVATSSFRHPDEDAVENTAALTPLERVPITATTDHDYPVVPEPSTNPGPRLTITFARSSARLLPIVQRWKPSEVALDGDVLGRQQLALFMSKLDRVRLCWLRRKAKGKNACRRSCRLGCDAFRIEPSQDMGYTRSSEAPWFAVGRFDGERVFVDKQALRDQVANDRNSGIRLCPFFDPGAVAAAIDGLPDTLAADDSTWALVYDFEGKPAWIWPHGQIPPSNLSSSADGGHRGVGVSFGFDLTGAAATNAPAGEQPAQRCVPATRYAAVLGQNAAVEAARDLIELPLKHADLFLRIGAYRENAARPRRRWRVRRAHRDREIGRAS